MLSLQIPAVAPPVHLTVPQDRITPISAEVQWKLALGPCLFAESKVELCIEMATKSAVKSSPPQLLILQTPSGSVCFSDLKPDTTYRGLFRFAHSGKESIITKADFTFQTKGMSFCCCSTTLLDSKIIALSIRN